MSCLAVVPLLGMSLSNPSTAAKAAFTIFGNSDNSQTIQGKNELQLQ